MKDIQQLIKKNSQEGRYEDIFPKTFIDAVEDRESGNNLTEILSGFNMYFLSYNGSRELTRLQVPMSIRKTGLWVTYVLYDKTVVTEWYAGEAIDDNSWGDSSNWRVGTNTLVGDISISSDGYWVINGVVTATKAQGEQGITPMLRVGNNNHLQVSYTNGSSWIDVSTNPVYTQFRVLNNKLQQSTDLGNTYTYISEELAYKFRESGNKIQMSKDLGNTWEDVSSNPVFTQFRVSNNKLQQSTDLGESWSNISEELAYKFRESGNKIQMSKDLGNTWEDVSTNPVYTQFRVHDNKLEQSVDLGATWIVVSDELAYQFRNSGNKLQVSKDLGVTWEDTSDYIAAWFRWQANDDNLGRIQISRDNNTWENFSPEFINRMLIKGFVTNLPQSAEYGDIYMVGPSYNQEDSEHANPYYRMWVMQDTWVDAGYYNKNTYNFNYNIKKTYPSVSAMDTDKSNPIGTNGLAIQIGDIVTVVNSVTPSENGVYSYEGVDNGWKYQSSFNFSISQVLGFDPNVSISQNTLSKEIRSILFPNYIEKYELNKYIADNTGIISNADETYRLSYFQVNVEQNFRIKAKNSHPILWQYTDSTYSTPLKQIIGGSTVDTKIVLEAGYYAICNVPFSNDTYYCYPTTVFEDELRSIELTLNTLDTSVNSFIKDSYKPLLSNVFSIYEVVHETLNLDGTICHNASPDYRLVKIHITEQKLYMIDCPVNGVRPILWQYTDSTYSTPLVEIIGVSNKRINKIVLLDAGYYVFAWNNNNIPSDILPNECIFISLFELNMIENFINSGSLINLASIKNISFNRYIHDTDGIITSASGDYRLFKFEVKTSDKYWLFSKYTNSHPILWQYTDSTYSTPLKQIIGGSTVEYNNVITLEAGYYAMCISGVFDELDFFNDIIISRVGIFFEKIPLPSNPVPPSFVSIENKDLSLNGSSTRDENNIITTGNGISNIVNFIGDYEGSHWIMSSVFSCFSGFSFIIGKGSNNTYGIRVEIVKENSISKINFYNNYGYTGGVISFSENLPFDLNENEIYLIKLKFDIGVQKSLSIELYGQFNEFYSHDVSDGVNAYGLPFFYSNSNSCVVKKFSLSPQGFYDLRNAKIAVWGHSFVEGDSLGANRMSSFTNLLAKEIGEKIVFNFGLGGDTTSAMISKIENELRFCKSVSYGLMCIGVNDAPNSNSIISNLQNAVNLLINSNIIPILFTIAPKNLLIESEFRTVNSWIRTSGYYYVDMEQVFLNVDATGEVTSSNIKNDLYLGDNVHPSVQGHLDIFHRIQMDCPFMF